MVHKCQFCRSEIPDGPANGKRETKCAKCQGNEAKYGKPLVCSYCQLPAAFRGGRCVHCSHSERKFGAPQLCSNCKLKAAFQDPNNATASQLCRLCKLSYKRSVLKASRKEKSGSSPPGKRSKISAFQEYGSNGAEGLGLTAATQLKDQVSNLERSLALAKRESLEKDRKIADLNAQVMHLERDHRAKVNELQRQSATQVKQLQDQLREQTRQLSLLSKSAKKTPPAPPPPIVTPLPLSSSSS